MFVFCRVEKHHRNPSKRTEISDRKQMRDAVSVGARDPPAGAGAHAAIHDVAVLRSLLQRCFTTQHLYKEEKNPNKKILHPPSGKP